MVVTLIRLQGGTPHPTECKRTRPKGRLDWAVLDKARQHHLLVPDTRGWGQAGFDCISWHTQDLGLKTSQVRILGSPSRPLHFIPDFIREITNSWSNPRAQDCHLMSRGTRKTRWLAHLTQQRTSSASSKNGKQGRLEKGCWKTSPGQPSQQAPRAVDTPGTSTANRPYLELLTSGALMPITSHNN